MTKGKSTVFYSEILSDGKTFEVVISNSRNDLRLTFKARSKTEAEKIRKVAEKVTCYVANVLPSIALGTAAELNAIQNVLDGAKNSQ